MLSKCQHSVYRLRLKKPLPWRVTGARVARHVEEPKGAAEAPYSTSCLLPANEPTTRDAFGAPSHPEVLHPEKCREGNYRAKHSIVESARVGEPPPPSRPAGEAAPRSWPASIVRPPGSVHRGLLQEPRAHDPAAAFGQGDQALAQLDVSRICRIRSRTLSLRLSAHYASFFRFGFRLIIRSRLRLVLDDHASVNQSLSCLPR